MNEINDIVQTAKRKHSVPTAKMTPPHTGGDPKLLEAKKQDKGSRCKVYGGQPTN